MSELKSKILKRQQEEKTRNLAGEYLSRFELEALHAIENKWYEICELTFPHAKDNEYPKDTIQRLIGKINELD